ncbi:unnamed protein product [Adineta ricciae]|uniref:PID domain-containing protein n=1 Tax=Adineta ricciae TaxID=249248 RepID=A0A814CF48_ADIRI|nr:unnamed protein product [Adineta ricciae]
MSSTSAYSLQLPYLGSIPLGKSPPSLASFQKPLRELYMPYYRQRRERYHDERRIIISDRDMLIFEPDAASKGKRSLIYATLESIVDIQALELYVLFNHAENHHHKRIRAAFLPIGCEQQERFRSLYSTIDKSQYHLLSTPTSSSISSSCHPPLVLFAIRKAGAGGTCSLIDCHVFAVRRESVAFDLCDMMRKLVIKRTMSPVLPSSIVAPSTNGTTLLTVHDNGKETTIERRTKYLDRDRPVSAMEHRQAEIQTGTDKKNNHSLSNMHLNDILHTTANGLTNPLTSSMFILTNNHQSNASHDPAQVLNNDKDHHRLSSSSSTPIRTLTTKPQVQQQRHFIKASSSTSSLVVDESDEVVNDLMNIVVAEKLKAIDTNTSQTPVKRHASFDQPSLTHAHNGHTMNKKRYQFHHNNNKKRSLLISSNPLPTIVSANNTPVISRTTTNIEQQSQPTSVVLASHLLRPQIVLNRYGDIGNYVPKLLRENASTTQAAMRSSDSNENIFFRATNGHLLNGFLNLNFSSTTAATTNGNHNSNNNFAQYRSTPCLNEEQHEQNVLSLVKQLRRNHTKSLINESECSVANQIFHIEHMDDDHRVPTCQIPRVVYQSQSVNKPVPAAMGGIKVLPLSPVTSYPTQRLLKSSCSSSLAKPRRVASFTIADTELPIDYRQYLRHTDQAAYLYGDEKQRQQQQQQQQQRLITLEHSLGYFP